MKSHAGTIAQQCASDRLRPAASRCGWLVLLMGSWVAAQTPEPASSPDATPGTTQAPAAAEAAAPTTPSEPASDAGEPAGTASSRRDAAQETFLRLTDEKRYEEAVTIAAQIVDLSKQMYGESSIEIAAPLVNLATAQVQTGDLAGAETNYTAAVTLIERHEGLVSARLVNPLTGLAETYVRSGMYAQASETFQRALRVNHADGGFYNLEQMRILDGLTEAFLGLEKLPQANAQQRTQVAIQERRSGENSAELVKPLYKLARWYNRTGQYVQSRDAYATARRIIRETSGESDPAMVDALLGESLTFENEGAIPSATSRLKSALEILDAQTEIDHVKRAEVLVALGDLYTVTRQWKSAGQRYGQAWQELSGDDSFLAKRDEYFARPSRIAGPRLPKYVLENGGESDSLKAISGTFADGVVVASMTVSPSGEAIKPSIIESDPPGLLDKRVVRALEATAFRPQVADGIPVETEGVQFRHEFRYQRTPPKKSEDTGVPADTTEGERIGYPGESDEPDGTKKP